MKVFNLSYKIKKSITTAFFLIPAIFNTSAQPVIPKFHDSPYQQPVFVALMIAIIFMLIMVLVLAGVLKSVLYHKREMYKNRNNSTTKEKITGIMVLLLGIPNLLMAQQASQQTVIPKFRTDWFGLDAMTFWSMVGLLLFEIIIALFYLLQIRKLLAKPNEANVPVKTKSLHKIMQLLTDTTPLEREKDVLLDHDYDGIKELDNNLPPWWKYGFYVTIVAGFIYLLHFHVFKTGKLQAVEYVDEIMQAELKLAEYRQKAANMIDENNVTFLTDESSLNEGKSIYNANCAVCHGNLGEGKVGPNLTDNYWLHGGSIQEIFKSIKYGWPDKGMKSWQSDLSSRQMHVVSSYIKSLTGTNPPNAKEPEGIIYTEQQTGTDSLSIDIAIDTLKK